jgi:hypothetical protein
VAIAVGSRVAEALGDRDGLVGEYGAVVEEDRGVVDENSGIVDEDSAVERTIGGKVVDVSKVVTGDEDSTGVFVADGEDRRVVEDGTIDWETVDVLEGLGVGVTGTI